MVSIPGVRHCFHAGWKTRWTSIGIAVKKPRRRGRAALTTHRWKAARVVGGRDRRDGKTLEERECNNMSVNDGLEERKSEENYGSIFARVYTCFMVHGDRYHRRDRL